jgi:hypothetical protein
LRPLLNALDCCLLEESTFTALGVSPQALRAGRQLEDRFRGAVEHLRDWLAMHDAELHHRLPVSWQDLSAARIALNARLQIEIPIPDRPPEIVNRRAHLQRPSACGWRSAFGELAAAI